MGKVRTPTSSLPRVATAACARARITPGPSSRADGDPRVGPRLRPRLAPVEPHGGAVVVAKLRFGDGSAEEPSLGPALEGGVLQELRTLGDLIGPRGTPQPREREDDQGRCEIR